MLLCVLGWAGVAAAQTTVTLRSSTAVEDASAPITLAHIALLAGQEAEALGSVVVVPDPGSQTGPATWW